MAHLQGCWSDCGCRMSAIGESGAGLFPARRGHIDGLLPRRRAGDSRRCLRAARASGHRLRHLHQRVRVLSTHPAPAGAPGTPRLDRRREDAVDAFFADAMAKSLLLDWGMQEGMHNTGLRTPYEMRKHYQKYETATISRRLTQDVLLMAGAEDHYIPVHQLPDQIATLTQVRSLTARLFTRTEQAQNHVQVGNFGLAFRVILDWMASLGTIEAPAAFGNSDLPRCPHSGRYQVHGGP
jgi:hypothetical protein